MRLSTVDKADEPRELFIDVALQERQLLNVSFHEGTFSLVFFQYKIRIFKCITIHFFAQTVPHVFFLGLSI